MQMHHLGVLLTHGVLRPSISLETLPECDDSSVATYVKSHLSFLGRLSMSAPAAHHSPDDAVVRAAQAGDRAAFGILYERYARMVHGVLLARVPASAVEDLVQDVFLRAMPRVSSLRDANAFGGWLAAIARNRAADFFRQTRGEAAPLEDSPEVEGRSESLGSHTGSDAQAILGAIRTLPEAYREPLILRLVEGMTGPEIAIRTGLTHGSVRVNLHRGMQRLKQILDAEGQAENSAVQP
jgi:RNA polymerase sigma-70 factor, ECF subfamily